MPVDDLDLGIERSAFLDRDHAVVADLRHGLGDELADLRVAIGRDRADLGDLHIRGNGSCILLQRRHDGRDRAIDAALHIHGIHAGGHRPDTAFHDRIGEHDRGRRAVASQIGGPGGRLPDQLHGHVLEPIVKLDVPCNGHAVLGDLSYRRTGRWRRCARAVRA